MKISQIKETCIYSRDIEGTISFYRDKVGLELFGYKEGKYAFFRAGSSVLLCFNPDDSKFKTSIPPHFGEGHLHFAFETSKADYPKWKSHIEKQGITIDHEQDWGNGFFSFYFRDNNNHCIEFITPGFWEYDG